jgi:hypothetical protein
MNEELQVIDLTYKLQYELSLLTQEELARYMQGKVLRYNDKLYHYIGDHNVTISEQHKSIHEQN